jgi:hypothetical protein
MAVEYSTSNMENLCENTPDTNIARVVRMELDFDRVISSQIAPMITLERGPRINQRHDERSFENSIVKMFQYFPAGITRDYIKLFHWFVKEGNLEMLDIIDPYILQIPSICTCSIVCGVVCTNQKHAINVAFRQSAKNRNFEVAEWLFGKYHKLLNDVEIIIARNSMTTLFKNAWELGYRDYNNSCLRIACRHGTLDFVEPMLRLVIKQVPDMLLGLVDIYYSRLFISTCESGNVDVAKYLYSEFAVSRDYLTINDVENALLNSVDCGRFEIVKWLVDVVETYYTPRRRAGSVSGTGCRFHPLDRPGIPQQDADTLDESFYEVIADLFECACGENHLEIAEWLYTKYLFDTPDIIHDNRDLFETCCLNDCVDVVEWFVGLFPRHFVVEIRNRSIRNWKFCKVFVCTDELIDSAASGKVNLECPICDITHSHYFKVIGCNHAFCGNCIGVWFNKSETCPMCRGPMDKFVHVMPSDPGYYPLPEIPLYTSGTHTHEEEQLNGPVMDIEYS